MGIPLVFDQDKKEIYNWKPQRFISIRELESKGYRYNEGSRLIIPANYSINPDRDVLKQISNIASEKFYVTISKKGAELLSYMKTQTSKALNRQLDLFLVKDFTNRSVKGIIDTKAMQEELRQMNMNRKDKSYTYGFINMLLSFFSKLKWVILYLLKVS